MKFKLNREALDNNMFKNGKVKHSTGVKFKLFPFSANAAQLKGDILTDLKDFKGITGTCFRECLGLSHKNSFDKESFIEAICLKAGAPDNPDLINIIEKVAFNELGQLVLFDPLIYPYVRNVGGNDNPTINNIGKYMAALFFDNDDKERLKKLTDKEPDNLFYKLILACIPSPENAVENEESYYPISTVNKKLFKVDFQTMLKDQEFFISNFHQLLKFYFFKYVTELSVELNQFFNDKKQKDQLFFSVKWEKLKSFRQPIINGWELFLSHNTHLFTHVVTIELINYIDGFGLRHVTYKELKECVNELNSEDKQNLVDCLSELNKIYQGGILDVNWENFDPDFSKTSNDPVYQQIHHLFQSIDFQFNVTARDRAKSAYQQWMREFVKSNFSKRRGQLGHSLNLDHEFLLFLTRLCVGDSDKIRLNKLWEELERRGVFLDNTSREHIIEYFEKINLLEKKSDSGDAQYVRKFSQSLV